MCQVRVSDKAVYLYELLPLVIVKYTSVRVMALNIFIYSLYLSMSIVPLFSHTQCSIEVMSLKFYSV